MAVRPVHTRGEILILTPLLPLFGVLWISWGHSNIYIGAFCCDRLPCWVILTNRLWKWGRWTADYVCSLLLWLIKWLPVPFIGLGKSIRSVPPIHFSCSLMRSVVSVRFGSMLLPTLLVVYLCSIVRKKVLTGTPFITCLLLIYTCYIG